MEFPQIHHHGNKILFWDLIVFLFHQIHWNILPYSSAYVFFLSEWCITPHPIPLIPHLFDFPQMISLPSSHIYIYIYTHLVYENICCLDQCLKIFAYVYSYAHSSFFARITEFLQKTCGFSFFSMHYISNFTRSKKTIVYCRDQSHDSI